MFNIQKSDQENIVQNNIQNSIKNRSINTQETTVASNIVCDEAQTIIVNAGFCGLTDKMTYPDGTEKIIQHQCSGGSTCNYNVENVSDCEQTDNLELNILSKTDTSFDTSVSNNISNELKNDVKIKTPSLLGGGLFSSQANNQLNKSINTQSTNIENDIRTKRKQLIVSNTEGDINASQQVDAPSGCGIVWNSSNRGKVAQESMKQITLKYFDKVSVSNDVKNIIKNDLSNTAELAGAGAYVVAIVGICLVLYKYVQKTNSGGILTSAVALPIYLMLAAVIAFTIYYIHVIITIMDNKDSFHYTVNCPNGYSSTGVAAVPELVDKCSNNLLIKKEWQERRGRETFPRWKVDENNNTVKANPDSISVRGVIWDEGLGKAIDYTTLNYDPLSSIDCGENGYRSDGTTKIEGCRSIDEDYEWENILKESCGCCDCNPEYIDYHNPVPSKVLDGGESEGEHIDKSLEILQPGTGYKNSGAAPAGIYETSCKRIDGTPCKKKSANGGVEDLLDEDSDNITVKLLSHESCSSKGGGDDDYALKCYKAAPHSGDYHHLFGLPEIDAQTKTAIRCVETGDWRNALGGMVGVCPFADDAGNNPNGCVRADKCDIDFHKNHVSPPGVAIGSGKSHCTSEGWSSQDQMNELNGNSPSLSSERNVCAYSVGGVKDILIETKPENHIYSPDHIYTIKKDANYQEDDLTTYFHLHDDDNLEDASASLLAKTGAVNTWWKHPGSASSVAPNIFSVSSRLKTTNGGLGMGDYDVVQSISCGNGTDVAVAGQEIITTALFDDTPFSSEKTSNKGTDLCLAKFRRLPACVKDEQGNDKTDVGCDEIYSPDEICLLCKNDSDPNEKSIPVNYKQDLNWDGDLEDSFFLSKPSKNKGGWAIIQWTILLVIIWIVSILLLYGYIRYIVAPVLKEVVAGVAEGSSYSGN